MSVSPEGAALVKSSAGKWRTCGLFGVSFVMLLGATFFSALVWESNDSRNWPHVPGTIVASYTERTCGSSKSGHKWQAKLIYRYSVAGMAHEAARVTNSLAYCDRSREAADSWVKKNYPMGKLVDVYYNPSSPDAAFLQPGVVARTDVVMIVVSLLMAGLFAYGGWRSARGSWNAKIRVRATSRIRIRVVRPR